VTAELTLDPRKDDFTGVEQIELAVDQPLPILWLNADTNRAITGTEPPANVIPRAVLAACSSRIPCPPEVPP